MYKITLFVIFANFMGFLASTAAFAQVAAAEEETASASAATMGSTEAASAEATETASSSSATSESTAATETDLKALEKRLAAQEEETAAAKQAREEMALEVESLKDEMEMVSMMSMEESSQKKVFSIYGFFDVSFFKQWFKYNNSPLKTQAAPYGTFLMNNINLYIKSEMTDSLEVLFETRYSFAPLGTETQLPFNAFVNGTYVPGLVDEIEYERVDTTVRSASTDEEYQYGSISIVRVHLDWKPRDWFNLRAGRFLTPYGIWNVEHAPTVLVSVYFPYLMDRKLVPASQMGLMAYGSHFFGEAFKLQYALTFSNGRGPIDTVMDLDENKAIGLRLQGIVRKGDFKLSVGGYGYMGQYSDVVRSGELYLDQTGQLQYINGSFIGGGVTVVEKYDERILTTDLSIELKGVKLFGEYVFKRNDYQMASDQSRDYQFVQNGDVGDLDNPRRAPDYTAHSFYGILAWTLPLDRFIAPVSITPYIGYDWIRPFDYYDWFVLKNVRWGINVKPSPNVVLKVEGNRVIYVDQLGGPLTNLIAQLAVSF